MEAICRAIVALVQEFDDIEFAIPVHPNPEVRATFERLRVAHERVQLMPPLKAIRGSSPDGARASDRDLFRRHRGGGAVLKKPVLVMRDVDRAVGGRRAWRGAADRGRNRLFVGGVRELLTDAAGLRGWPPAARPTATATRPRDQRRVRLRATGGECRSGARGDEIGIGAALFPDQSRDHVSLIVVIFTKIDFSCWRGTSMPPARPICSWYAVRRVKVCRWCAGGFCSQARRRGDCRSVTPRPALMRRCSSDRQRRARSVPMRCAAGSAMGAASRCARSSCRL